MLHSYQCLISSTLVGALGVNLQTSGPIQSTIFNMQCTGLEGGLLSCSHETDMSCESADAGIVCQGEGMLFEIAVHSVHSVHCTPCM